MKRERKVHVNFTAPKAMTEEIERISQKRNIPKAQVYLMMIDLGIDCHKDLERLGIVQAVDFAHFIKTALKDKLKKDGPKQLSIL